MTIVEFLVLLVVAGICGAVAQAITGMSRGGILVSIAVGFIGALLGRWISEAASIAPILEVEIGGKSFPIIWSVLGGVLFSFAISFATKNSKKTKS